MGKGSGIITAFMIAVTRGVLIEIFGGISVCGHTCFKTKFAIFFYPLIKCDNIACPILRMGSREPNVKPKRSTYFQDFKPKQVGNRVLCFAHTESTRRGNSQNCRSATMVIKTDCSFVVLVSKLRALEYKTSKVPGKEHSIIIIAKTLFHTFGAQRCNEFVEFNVSTKRL